MLAVGSAAAQEDCNLQYDGNGDGAVNVEDVLGVLSEFGEVCEPTGFVTCGDNISFDGYSYSTVLIGDQCWFQENLRTAVYQNGDSIPAQLTNSEWQFTSSDSLGAQAVFGETGQASGGVADYDFNLETFGRLYNWYAVNDARSICPTNWHVPTQQDWLDLLNSLGTPDPEFEQTHYWGVGYLMKSSPTDTPPWNGINTTGFSGLPGGIRNGWGMFDYGDDLGFYWSSTPFWRLLLVSTDGELSSAQLWQAGGTQGLSVRCIKD